MTSFDPTIFYWLNSWTAMYSWLDTLIIFHSEFLGYWLIGGVFTFLFAAIFKKYRYLREKNFELVAFSFAAALIARFGVGEIIRFLYNRPRPFEVLNDVHQLIFHEAGNAFPSGHALFFFALATGVSFYYPKTSILFFVGAILMSIARVQAGIHWPSDIIIGAILGIATTLIMRFLFLKCKKPNL